MNASQRALTRRLAVSVLALSLLATVPSEARAQDAAWPPPECEVAGPGWTPTVGTVACVTLDSPSLGGPTPVSYVVPEVCRGRRCPVVYNLHGFGGTYATQLGTSEQPSAWVAALTSRPPVDPPAVDDPWSYADPAGWEAAEPLTLIQVTTHGRTLPGGFGPRAGLEGFYSDWNPRYAAGGANQRYDTPPPRFETFLLDELLPFVEDRFPTRAARAYRAITGVSLGGFGSYKLGLAHPDVFAVIGSVSGAHNFLFAPSVDDAQAPDTSAPFVVDLGAILLPSTTGGATLPLGPAEGFTVPFTAYGDTVADQPYFRGNMPVDLAGNARAEDATGAQLPVLNAFVNDAVPRRGEDVTDPAGYVGAQALEAIVLAMNADQELAFDQHGVERTFAVHPGLHSGVYWNPWLRSHLEALAGALAPPGSAQRPVEAARFDHRSIATAYTIWGWNIAVERDTVEFLDLFDVTCREVTLRGTGTVTVDVPERCATGRRGEDGAVVEPFTVELGPGSPVVASNGVNPGAARVTVPLELLARTGPRGGGSTGSVATDGGVGPTPATGGGSAVLGVLVLLAGVRIRTTGGTRRS